MPLSRRDLEQIRIVVREEFARLSPQAAVEASLDDLEEDGRRFFMRELARQRITEMRHTEAERRAQPIPDTPYLSTYDGSRLSGIQPDTLRGMAKRGDIASRKVRGRLEINRTDLDAWRAKHPPRR